MLAHASRAALRVTLDPALPCFLPKTTSSIPHSPPPSPHTDLELRCFVFFIWFVFLVIFTNMYSVCCMPGTCWVLKWTWPCCHILVFGEGGKNTPPSSSSPCFTLDSLKPTGPQKESDTMWNLGSKVMWFLISALLSVPGIWWLCTCPERSTVSGLEDSSQGPAGAS